MIDWESQETSILWNVRLPQEDMKEFAQRLPTSYGFERHLWIATSGSTGLKFVALSKDAILASAQAVNFHLNSNAKDVWINPLPFHHVGGLSILARCYLSGAQAVDLKGKWDASAFCKEIDVAQGTLSSLVPAQVFDLTSAQLPAPKSLRALFVGGGALSPSVYDDAIQLGWPLLPSYGLTECSSQVATASLDSLFSTPYRLQILPHVEVKINLEGLICLKSPALLSAYAYPQSNGWEIVDPKIDKWFTTQDLGRIEEDNTLEFIGRQSDQIKIGGELVSMFRLEKVLEEIRISLGLRSMLTLVAIPDPRLESVVHLAAQGDSEEEILPVVEAFNAAVLPYERIRRLHMLLDFPLSSLKKPLKGEILKRIMNPIEDFKEHL